MANPVVEYSFDEASGTVLNTGTSGSGDDVTLTGNTARTAAGGGYTALSGGTNSKGLTQSAADNQAGPASLTSFNVSSRTVMFWLKMGAASTFWAGELRRTTEDTGVYGVLNLSDSPRFRAKDSSNNVYESATFSKDAGNWHHIAATHDGTNLKVYRDGTQVGSNISMPVAVWTATGMRLLDQSGSGTVIDHFRYFNSALTSTEVNTWMNTNTPTTSGTDLVVADMAVATSEDNATLTQVHNLAAADATVASSSDNAVLVQAITLGIQKMLVATRHDAPDLTQVHQIVVNKAFLQTSADLVNMSGLSGGPMSVADLQAQKLPALTGKTGSVQDLLFAYYGGLSGLVPVAQFSISDHQKVYYAAQTGKPASTNSMADLEKAFYDFKLVPSGTLSDREFVYWTGL